MKGPNDMMNMDGCVVRDERGVALAILHEADGVVLVKKMTSCSIGTYLHIITFLKECGFDAR